MTKRKFVFAGVCILNALNHSAVCDICKKQKEVWHLYFVDEEEYNRERFSNYVTSAHFKICVDCVIKAKVKIPKEVEK